MKRGFVLIFLSFFILGFLLSAPIILADEDSEKESDSSGSGSSGDSSDSESDSSGSSGDDEDNSGSGSDEEDKVSEEVEREFFTYDYDSFGSGSGDRTRFESEIKDGEEKIKFEIRRRIIDEDGNVREIRIKIEERIVDGEILRKIKVVGRIGGDIEARTKLDIREIVRGNESIIKAILSNGNEIDIRILPDRIAEIALEILKSRNFTIELREDVHKNVPRVIYNIQTNKNGRFLGIFKLKIKLEAQIDPETGEVLGITKPWWAFLVFGEEDPDETEDGFDEEEDFRIKAETFNGSAEVKVELEFNTQEDSENQTIADALNKLNLNSEEVDLLLEMETSEEPLEDKDELEFEINDKGEGIFEVDFRLEYFLNNTDNRTEIVDSIVIRLSELTEEDLNNALLA